MGKLLHDIFISSMILLIILGPIVLLLSLYQNIQYILVIGTVIIVFGIRNFLNKYLTVIFLSKEIRSNIVTKSTITSRESILKLSDGLLILTKDKIIIAKTLASHIEEIPINKIIDVRTVKFMGLLAGIEIEADSKTHQLYLYQPQKWINTLSNIR